MNSWGIAAKLMGERERRACCQWGKAGGGAGLSRRVHVVPLAMRSARRPPGRVTGSVFHLPSGD
eukprot:349615-Chlamydomonas_euryale.AAC.3